MLHADTVNESANDLPSGIDALCDRLPSKPIRTICWCCRTARHINRRVIELLRVAPARAEYDPKDECNEESRFHSSPLLLPRLVRPSSAVILAPDAIGDKADARRSPSDHVTTGWGDYPSVGSAWSISFRTGSRKGPPDWVNRGNLAIRPGDLYPVIPAHPMASPPTLRRFLATGAAATAPPSMSYYRLSIASSGGSPAASSNASAAVTRSSQRRSFTRSTCGWWTSARSTGEIGLTSLAPQRR